MGRRNKRIGAAIIGVVCVAALVFVLVFAFGGEDTTSETSTESSEDVSVDVSEESDEDDEKDEKNDITEDEDVADDSAEDTSQESDATAFRVSSLSASTQYHKILLVHTANTTTTSGVFEYYEYVDGTWLNQLSTTCYVGKAGIGDASEYSTKTPTGLYTFTMLFGNDDDPGTLLGYHKLDDNDYWCGETYYNQFVDEDVQSHDCSKTNDEHLSAATTAYRLVAAFNYNASNTRGEGFAFFLHNNFGNTNTDGCITIPYDAMSKIIKIIDANSCIIIDTDANLQNY